jgi:hypothetical protein
MRATTSDSYVEHYITRTSECTCRLSPRAHAQRHHGGESPAVGVASDRIDSAAACRRPRRRLPPRGFLLRRRGHQHCCLSLANGEHGASIARTCHRASGSEVSVRHSPPPPSTSSDSTVTLASAAPVPPMT